MPKGEPMEIHNPTKSEIGPEESYWWLKFVPQPNVWTNVNIFRFLRLYQTYPLLWDPNNPKYSKSSERSRAYGEISKKLNLQGVHEKECMKLIKSLKKIYIEEKQKREEAKSSSQKYKPPPVWFQALNDIVQCIIHNEKEKASSDSNTNEIKTKSIESTKLIKCFKIRIDNIWTPNYFKTDLWRMFVPKTSYVTEEEKENIVINNKDISNESYEALKPTKPNYGSEFQSILQNSSSHRSQKKKEYCPDFDNILCNRSSKSNQNIKKYCPEFKNTVCDCSSKSSQSIKNYCPEFENILCDCSSKSSQSVKKYCPEFENIICDCSSETKYSPENKNLGDYSSKASSDSKLTRDSDSKMLKVIIATPLKLTIPICPVKKYENSYVVDLDRYCSYKDWNKYYNINICGSKEYYEEPLQPEKKIDDLFSNKKPPRFHKNNILESDINLFSEMNRNYEFQLYNCIKNEY